MKRSAFTLPYVSVNRPLYVCPGLSESGTPEVMGCGQVLIKKILLAPRAQGPPLCVWHSIPRCPLRLVDLRHWLQGTEALLRGAPSGARYILADCTARWPTRCVESRLNLLLMAYDCVHVSVYVCVV